MKIKCPYCETGELVKDLKQAYYVLFEEGCEVGSLIEPTNYDPDEMNGEIYCDNCLEFITRTEIEKIVSKLKKG